VSFFPLVNTITDTEVIMSTLSPYGFGMLCDVVTGTILRGATRDELIATIPIDSRRIQVTIKVEVAGDVYDCIVKYQQ
jgi:hypothetical protein